jgi:hypothetical protein
MKQRKLASNGSKVKVTSIDRSSHSASQSSINNDWENWLVLHGNNKVVTDDVCEIGKIGGY